jgi:hypothetical protein
LVAVHALFHVYEELLVYLDDSFVNPLGEIRAHALVETFREEDFVCNEWGREIEQ